MMDIDKIKQKILDLAIRGKLVPQDPNDEPASVLVEKIKAEKEKMVKEGKIKPSKDESYIYKDSDNCYYENQLKTIPDNWMLCRFGSIVSIKRGASPRPIKSHLTNSEDGVNWIKIGDALPGDIYINSTAQKIKKESIDKSVFLKKGALILSNSMSFGRPYILNIDGCIHDGWLAIEIYDNSINKEFLQYILQGYMWYFKSKASGSGVDNLNIDKVKDMPFALPPIKEQKRILNKLRKIDEFLKKIDVAYDEIQNYAEAIKHKILNLYFGENSSYKSYYGKKKIKEIIKPQSIGNLEIKIKNIQSLGTIPVVSQSAALIDGFVNECVKPLSEVPYIVFGDHTKNVKYIDFPFIPGADGTKVFKPKDGIEPKLLYYYSLYASNNIESCGYARHFSKFKNVTVPIFDVNTQKNIICKLDKAFALIDDYIR
jgi:restriction endonuclease S subunit